MSIILPDRETLDILHDAILWASGGKSGVHDEKLILSAIERPATYTQYVDDYDLDTICAVLIDSIARYHGFRDGNKRTALITTIFTYRINDVHFNATVDMNNDFDDLVMWVVTEKPDIPAVVDRLKELRKLHECEEQPSWWHILTAYKDAILGKKHHK